MFANNLLSNRNIVNEKDKKENSDPADMPPILKSAWMSGVENLNSQAKENGTTTYFNDCDILAESCDLQRKDGIAKFVAHMEETEVEVLCDNGYFAGNKVERGGLASIDTNDLSKWKDKERRRQERAAHWREGEENAWRKSREQCFLRCRGKNPVYHWRSSTLSEVDVSSTITDKSAAFKEDDKAKNDHGVKAQILQSVQGGVLKETECLRRANTGSSHRESDENSNSVW